MIVIPIPDIFIQVFSHEGHVNNKICSIFIPISDSMNIEHFETKNCSIGSTYKYIFRISK